MSQARLTLTPDISLRIGRLRALSILLVVMTHSNKILAVLNPSMSPVQLFVTADVFQNIGHLCIPFYFSLSGYLFFLRPPKGLDGYLTALRKKMRTVLLPMVVLNGALYLYLTHVGSIPFIGGGTVAAQKGIAEGIFGLWGSPLNYPLWFLRDLFLLFALYPVLAVVLSEIPWTGFFVLCWIWQHVSSPVDFVSLVFFYFGGLLAVTGADLGAGRRLLPVYACAYGFCLVFLGLQAAETGVLNGDVLIYRMGLVVGVLLFWQLSAFSFITRNRLLERLAPYGFMIYLFHEPMLSLVIFGITKASLFQDKSMVFLPQIVCWIVTLAATWLVVALMRRLCPPLYILLSGGRA